MLCFKQSDSPSHCGFCVFRHLARILERDRARAMLRGSPCPEVTDHRSYERNLRGCLPKIFKPILDYITDLLETFCVIHTLVG